MSQPRARFASDISCDPVSKAIRSSAATISGSTRFRTISGRSTRFFTVWALVPIPSIAVYPSHHADDIGARFAVPSGLSVLTSTTGVPK